MADQRHHLQAGRGDTAGRRRHASAYEYDPEIADAAQKRLHDDPRLRDSALWITVQRRFITLQGCAASARQTDYVADALRHLPDLQHVTVDVTIRRHEVHHWLLLRCSKPTVMTLFRHGHLGCSARKSLCSRPARFAVMPCWRTQIELRRGFSLNF